MVATADSTDENWPATMEYRGVAYKKGSGQDSCDVVYVEDYGKFLAFSTYNRFTESSGIAVMESNDGITFEQVAVIRTGISQYCHNMGISKRPNGHIQMDDEISFIGYAYSSGGPDSGYWGKWATRFQDIDLSVYEGEITDTDEGGKGACGATISGRFRRNQSCGPSASERCRIRLNSVSTTELTTWICIGMIRGFKRTRLRVRTA